MALIYPGQWKFEGIGIEISQHTSNEFYELVEKIADGKKNIVEGFKMAFGGNGVRRQLTCPVRPTHNQ